MHKLMTSQIMILLFPIVLIANSQTLVTQPPPVIVKHQNWLFLKTRPAIDNSGCFYAAGRKEGNFNGIVAFDSTTLEVKWGPVQPCTDYGEFGVSVGADGLIYSVGEWNWCGNGRLIAMKADGAIAWEHRNESQHPRQTPAIDDDEGAVYFGSSNIQGINYKTRTAKWTRREGFYIGDGGICLDAAGNVYVSTHSGVNGNTKILSISRTGALRWSRTFQMTRGNGPSVVAIPNTDTILLYHRGASQLLAWNSADGSDVWAGPNLDLAVTDHVGNIYGSSADDNTVVSLTATGQTRWTIRLTGHANVALDFIDEDGHVYVRADSSLYALNGENGEILWKFQSDALLSIPAALTPTGRIFLNDAAGTGYLLDTHLRYASSSWPIARFGNERHTGKSRSPANPPLILSGPQHKLVQIGSTLELFVDVSGSPPFMFQWRKDGTNVPGATQRSLVLEPITSLSSGTYSVVISNEFGSVTSLPSRVRVYYPPNIPQPEAPSVEPASTLPSDDLLSRPRKPSSDQLIIFNSSKAIDRQKMTVVMTHGWLSSSAEWPTSLAKALVELDHPCNVVAWDWRMNALGSPSTAAARTMVEGEALGSELLYLLGPNYALPIHFLGHSLGTLVNCHAADFIHGDSKNSPGNHLGSQLKLDPLKTHMTLFDPAELVIALKGVHVLLGMISAPAHPVTSDLLNNPWTKVVPSRSAWVDNYISGVGLIHKEAANVLLWRESSLNPVKVHGYAYQWYDRTIRNPTESQMGHKWSFERNSLQNAPLRGTYYLQSALVNQSELELVDVSNGLAAALAGGYGIGANRLLVYPTLKAYQGYAELGTAVKDGVKAGIRFLGNLNAEYIQGFVAPQEYKTIVGSTKSSTGYSVEEQAAPVLQAVWDLQMTIESPPISLKPQSLNALSGTPELNSVCIWVPVEVPADAIGFSFEFKIDQNTTNEFLTVAFGAQSVLSVEARFVDEGSWTSTGIIEIMPSAETRQDMLIALSGDSQRTGKLSVRGIRFYLPPTPSLTIERDGAFSTLSWPLSAENWQLERSIALNIPSFWTPLTNGIVKRSYESIIKDMITDTQAYYRLRRIK